MPTVRTKAKPVVIAISLHLLSVNRCLIYSLRTLQTMTFPGYVNVRDPPSASGLPSAAGDATTDDTPAIQEALNYVGTNVGANGGVVFLPTGNYRIRTHLSVPADTSLVGVFRAPTAFSQNKGTTLLAEESLQDSGGTAFITLGPDTQESNACLDGVTIFYPNQNLDEVQQNGKPVEYPWTVRGGGGDNVTIQNVLLVNPYNAIDLFTKPSGRHLVRGVYGQPLRTGIQVDKCYDIGRIMDVHFWNFWTGAANVDRSPGSAALFLEAYTFHNAFSFVFYRTDWQVVQDIFSWGYHVGALFGFTGTGPGQGGMVGQMSNVNFDNVDVGLALYGTGGDVHISNLNLASDPQPDQQVDEHSTHIGIFADPGEYDAMLNVNNVSFWGDFSQAVLWKNSGVFSMSNARIAGGTLWGLPPPPLTGSPWWSAQTPHLKPKIEILYGRAMIHDNYFMDDNNSTIDPPNVYPPWTGIAIHVGSNAGDVMICNNNLEGSLINNEGLYTVELNNIKQGDSTLTRELSQKVIIHKLEERIALLEQKMKKEM
jgi:hypothetical protein